jgi:hypothetical protein
MQSTVITKASTMNHSEKVIAILSKTRDGDALNPNDLKLCEIAANNRLSELGKEAFETLYEVIAKGEYETSGAHWHLGIRHLTKSGNGYVSWKGKIVEHYSFGNIDQERLAAEKLAKYCEMLDAKGFPVNMRTATFSEIYTDAPAGTPWLPVMLNYYTFFADQSGKARWAVFTTANRDAVAVRMVDGQPEVRFALDSEAGFGTYTMFHALQDDGFQSCSDRIRTYADIERIMGEIGISPQQAEAAINTPVPQPPNLSAPAP